MFEAIGMRAKVSDPQALVINTCSDNDTRLKGSSDRWSWSNPTNRRFMHRYEGVTAVSTEALWQGTKVREGQERPDEATLAGDWRRGKGKRPKGAWAGDGKPLITTPGGARREIYIPAFSQQIEMWIAADEEVAGWVAAAKARAQGETVYLRDHDTGRGIDRNGPMSHAWLLSVFLNDGEWPV